MGQRGARRTMTLRPGRTGRNPIKRGGRCAWS